MFSLSPLCRTSYFILFFAHLYWLNISLCRFGGTARPIVAVFIVWKGIPVNELRAASALSSSFASHSSAIRASARIVVYANCFAPCRLHVRNRNCTGNIDVKLAFVGVYSYNIKLYTNLWKLSEIAEHCSLWEYLTISTAHHSTILPHLVFAAKNFFLIFLRCTSKILSYSIDCTYSVCLSRNDIFACLFLLATKFFRLSWNHEATKEDLGRR